MQDDQPSNKPENEPAGHLRFAWTDREIAIFREGIARLEAMKANHKAREAVTP